MNPKFTQEVLDLTKNPNFNFSVDADPINKTAFIAFQNGSMHPLLKDALSTIKPGEKVIFYININNFDDDISNDSIYHSNDMYGDCVRIDSDMGSIRDWCDRGISELNKEETDNLFNIFKETGYQTFNHQILNRMVETTFSEGNYDSKFYKKSGKYYLSITCPKNYDELKLKTIITHELSHFIEVSKIEDKKYRYPNYNKIKKSLIEFNSDSKQLQFFKHLIYKTLDNEINANVSQTYTYLRSFNSSDENYLKSKLEEYEMRKEYQKLLNFNVSKFKTDIKSNKIDFKEFNEILIKNGVDQFLDFIYEKNIDRYIEYWFKIIKTNIKKLLKKQDNIVKEVIEDINKLNNYSSEYPISETLILNYTEYLKDNLRLDN